MTSEVDRSSRPRFFVSIGALFLFVLFDAGLAIQRERNRRADAALEATRTEEVNAVLSEVEQQRERASELTDQAEAIVAEFDRPKADPSAKPAQPQPRPSP
jgi:hypothetical protein